MPAAVVFLGNEQDDHPVDEHRWLQLAKDVLKAEKVTDEVEVSLLYVDETTIAQLNEKFLGKSGPTDVLSFPIDEGLSDAGRTPDGGGTGPGSGIGDDEPASLLGDIVICPAVAYRNAPDHAGTYEDELALLLVHGILHLLGMDHQDDDEASVMEAKERKLLSDYYQPIRRSAWGGEDT